MGIAYDEFELTESAYRPGYDDGDVADMLRGRHLLVRSRRGWSDTNSSAATRPARICWPRDAW